MSEINIADIAAAYNRVRLFVIDMFGMGQLRPEASVNLQADLKASLMLEGSKNGLVNIEEFVNRLFRADVITRTHWKNLLLDLETLKKAEL